MPNEEALKQLIASLPNPENDPDDDPEVFGLGPEEISYLYGLRDALQILNGQPIETGYIKGIRQNAETG